MKKKINLFDDKKVNTHAFNYLKRFRHELEDKCHEKLVSVGYHEPLRSFKTIRR